jgi:hypothetical protein
MSRPERSERGEKREARRVFLVKWHLAGAAFAAVAGGLCAGYGSSGDGEMKGVWQFWGIALVLIAGLDLWIGHSVNRRRRWNAAVLSILHILAGVSLTAIMLLDPFLPLAIIVVLFILPGLCVEIMTLRLSLSRAPQRSPGPG